MGKLEDLSFKRTINAGGGQKGIITHVECEIGERYRPNLDDMRVAFKLDGARDFIPTAQPNNGTNKSASDAAGYGGRDVIQTHGFYKPILIE